MYRHIVTLLLTVFISACGGGGDESSDVITVSKPPKATNVALKGSEIDNGIQSGQEVIGQYTFNSASIPPGLDASIGFWETESGTSIHRGLKYRIPRDNSLAGTRIRFCVKPFNRIDRKAGKKACSKFVLITPVFFDPSSPMVKILSNAYTPEVVGGELLTFIINKNGDSVDGEHGFRWKRNGQIIPNENSDSYLLTVADEGKYISVCIINQVTNTLISCSEETNAIQAAAGIMPSVYLEPLSAKVEVGQNVLLDYHFIDLDNDKEDIDTTSFSWFVDDNRVSIEQSLLVDASMVHKKLKGCVTPYSLTGWPKSGEMTCTEEVIITPIAGDLPRANNVAIMGHRFEGKTVEGSYDYFDLNNNHETASLFTWSIIKNGQETVVGQEQGYTLQSGDEGKGNKIRFCVVALNNQAQGIPACVTEDIAWLDGEGSFKEGGEVTANLEGYPEFSQSYWLSSDKGTAFPLAINTRSNDVSPLAIESSLPNFINLRPMRLCVSFDNNLLNSDDVCREIPVGNKLTRSISLKDDRGVHAAININQFITVDDVYRLHRPSTWSEFKALPDNMQSEFSSAEPSHLIGESYSGLKMTPKQANEFCLLMHGATGLASPVFYYKFATGSGLSHSWPTELTLQEFVAKGLGGYYQLDKSGLIPPIPADLGKKYSFMCVSLVPQY
ncbi:hypothetical protein [Photobacterium sanguinicancri]|uniref:hypothetical protein n=1 Tax=Photobacterium sanguinicancri TaxID=875932 RepID=UPI003D0BF454